MNSSNDALREALELANYLIGAWEDLDRKGIQPEATQDSKDSLLLARAVLALSAQGEQPSSEAAPCPACGGCGQVEIGRHLVTREMASDAGEPAMEGMDGGPEYGRCPECGGSGQIASPQPQGEQYRVGLEKAALKMSMALHHIEETTPQFVITKELDDAWEELTAALEAIRAHAASLREGK